MAPKRAMKVMKSATKRSRNLVDFGPWSRSGKQWLVSRVRPVNLGQDVSRVAGLRLTGRNCKLESRSYVSSGGRLLYYYTFCLRRIVLRHTSTFCCNNWNSTRSRKRHFPLVGAHSRPSSRGAGCRAQCRLPGPVPDLRLPGQPF